MKSSGRGPLPLPGIFLGPLEGLYRSIVALDGWRHRRRIRAGQWPLRLDRPVLSVGNIVAGGTGKTPVVEELARQWLRLGGHPGILSRGYRSYEGWNDEFHLLRCRLPGVPHRQHPDRYRAGLQLLTDHPEVDLLILDDGFQHRRLHRDLDVVLVDSLDPFGGGHCLPRGWLREPWRSLARADHILITRVERCQPAQLQETRTILGQYFGSIPRHESRTRIEGLTTLDGTSAGGLSALRLACFCAIGHPQSFFDLLRSKGARVLGVRTFRDHHRYRSHHLRELRRWGRDLGADALVCTEKDAVKIQMLPPPLEEGLPLLKLRIRVEFESGEILGPLGSPGCGEGGDPGGNPC